MTNNYFEIDKNGNLKKGIPHLLKKNKPNKDFGIAKYMNMGYYLIIPIVFGIFFGLFLDKKFQTNKIFFSIFFPLGVFASFYNLYKIYIDERSKSN